MKDFIFLPKRTQEHPMKKLSLFLIIFTIMPIYGLPDITSIISFITVVYAGSNVVSALINPSSDLSQKDIQEREKIIQEIEQIIQKKTEKENNIPVDINTEPTIPLQDIPFNEPIFFENIEPNFTPEPHFSAPQEIEPKKESPKENSQDIKDLIPEQPKVVKEQPKVKPKNNKPNKTAKNGSHIPSSVQFLNKYIIEDY